jgi:hypothetical protein
MKVQYLTGSPTMENLEYIGKKKGRVKAFFKKAGGVAKKVSLAPVRNAFLALVRLNARGLAKKLNIALQKDSSTTKQFWEKLGGNFNALQNAINAGKSKKPLAGESKKNRALRGVGFYYADTEEAYIGEYDLDGNRIGAVETAAVLAFLTAAAPALIAVSRLFKKNNIPEDEESGGETISMEEEESSEKLPAGFEAADPEPGAGTGAGLNLGFKPSPLLIGGIVGGLALVYFLTKKKK